MNRCLFCSLPKNHICIDLADSTDFKQMDINDYLVDTLFLFNKNKELAEKKFTILLDSLTPTLLLSIFLFIELNEDIIGKRKQFFINMLRQFYRNLSNKSNYNNFDVKKYLKIFEHKDFIQ